MKRPLTEEELYEIKQLIDKQIASRQKEINLLRNIKADAEYNSISKLENHIIKFSGEAEATFLEGKRLAIFTKDGIKTTAFDVDGMGTTDIFPAKLSNTDGVWEFFLPPMYSLTNRKYGKNAGRYIGYLVRNLIHIHEGRYGKIQRLNDPVVVFEHGIIEALASSRLFDAENRDNKKVLDVLTGIFIEDDNLLSVKTAYFGVPSKEHYTRVYIMEAADFPIWASRNMLR